MNNLTFKNQAHREFFFNTTMYGNIDFRDRERTAMIYVLGLMSETRQRFNSFYDVLERCIRPEVLHAGFQTSGTRALTLLAFNLYNNFQDQEYPATVLDIFSVLDAEYLPFLLQAISLRLGQVTITS